MNHQTFEEYLREIHDTEYRGFDDEQGDDYQDWITEKSAEEIIEYAEEFFRRELYGRK